MEFALNLQKIMLNDNYLIAIRDNFENLLIKSVLNITDKKIQSEEIELHVKNRIFSVIVECVQNICKTEKGSDRKKDSVLLLNRINNGYRIVAGSKIDLERKKRLSELLTELSGKSVDKIREHWRFALTDKKTMDVGKQENLALIELFLRSHGNVNYFFSDEENEMSFFMIQIEISNI